MIKFTDILKANGRYWYAIIVLSLVIFGIVFGVTFKPNYYIADTTYVVNVSGKPNSTTAELVYKELNIIIHNDSFVDDLEEEIAKTDKPLASKVKDMNIPEKLNISYTKGDATFKLVFNNANETYSAKVLEVASKLAIQKYSDIHPGTNVEFNRYYSIQTNMAPNKNVTYGIIAIVVGLIISEIVLVCFISFNPYVENKDILSRNSGNEILSTIKGNSEKDKLQNDKEYAQLANNIEIVLKDKKSKVVALSNDSDKFEIDDVINNLASIYTKNKKVLVLSYEQIANQNAGIEYNVISDKDNDYDKIKETYDNYDIVLVKCPNIIANKTYIHTAMLTKTMVVVAQKWKSKLDNMVKINSYLKAKDFDVLGIVYKEK